MPSGTNSIRDSKLNATADFWEPLVNDPPTSNVLKPLLQLNLFTRTTSLQRTLGSSVYSFYLLLGEKGGEKKKKKRSDVSRHCQDLFWITSIPPPTWRGSNWDWATIASFSISSNSSRTIILSCPPQLPCVLKRKSAAARLLGSRVPIPMIAWIFVCCDDSDRRDGLITL